MALLHTNRWTVLNSRLCIKGFASMLVQTGHTTNSVLWHYLYGQHSQYLPSNQSMVDRKVSVNLEQIEKYRHFIGWCSQAKSNAGSRDICFDIRRSLSRPRAKTTLKGFTLSGEKFGIYTGLFAILGRRDSPLRQPFSPSRFLGRLKWAENHVLALW